MARLIINPLSNYEMVKTNETCAASFLMSRFPYPESLIASARVVFLEAHGDHEMFQFSPEDLGEDGRDFFLMLICVLLLFSLFIKHLEILLLHK